MATYKGIQGYSVQKLSTDPTVEDTVGQLWYNSTSGAFKISTEGAGAWSSGGALTTGRNYPQAARNSTQTAGLAFGGYNSGGRAETETYNGTAWSEVNDLNVQVELDREERELHKLPLYVVQELLIVQIVMLELLLWKVIMVLHGLK